MTTTTPGNMIVLTIQPGFLFSELAVRFMRLQRLTDDVVAADIEAVENGAVLPAVAARWARDSRLPGAAHYVRDIVRAAGVELVAGIGGAA